MRNRWKRIGSALLFPHPVVVGSLFLLAVGLLIYTFAAEVADPILVYGSYLLSSYVLMILCARIPALFFRLRRFKDGNKYLRRYTNEPQLRVRLSLYVAVSANSLYSLMQLSSGIHYNSFWFYSLAGYYALLAVMRFFLLRDTHLQAPILEWKRYRFCGILLLGMDFALAGMVYFIVRFGRGFEYPYILTIALAAFTFFAVTMAIINVVKYRRYERPVLSAAKAISLASAFVSLLSLETAMFAAFDQGEDPSLRHTVTSFTGVAVCLSILGMAVYMIIRSNKEIKRIQK